MVQRSPQEYRDGRLDTVGINENYTRCAHNVLAGWVPSHLNHRNPVAKNDLAWLFMAKNVPYRWTRPAFLAMKTRRVELQARAPKAHGKAGPARDYRIKELREHETGLVTHAEAAYAMTVEAWREKPPKTRET